MRILAFVATNRGLRFLKKLSDLAPEAELCAFVFRETAHEPPFLDCIRAFAESKDIPLQQTRTLSPQAVNEIAAKPFDLLFAVSWRYLIPTTLFRRARLGAYLFHDSLLPRYRGFAPTPWAIINGERSTGVSLLEMAEEIDAGPLLAQEEIAIGPDDSISEIMELCTLAYLELLEENFDAIANGLASTTPQDHTLATYCCKRLPSDGQIDWHSSTRRILNLIRATSRPYPGAFTRLNGEKIKIWKAIEDPKARVWSGSVPGRVLDISADGLPTIATANGAVLATHFDWGESDQARSFRYSDTFS